jgi:hypothetical protein
VQLLTLRQAEASADIDVKLVSVRSSRYRVFGSSERIPVEQIAVADIRDGDKPADFDQRFQILDRHPAKPIYLVRKSD